MLSAMSAGCYKYSPQGFVKCHAPLLFQYSLDAAVYAGFKTTRVSAVSTSSVLDFSKLLKYSTTITDIQ